MFRKDSSPKILVVRTDRIGDVILSTPVIEALVRFYPSAHIDFAVQKLTEPLVAGLPGVKGTFIYEPKGRHRGIKGFRLLMTELKEQEYNAAVVLFSDLRMSAALFGIGIPLRIGRYSKPHSFLFFNRGNRQRRSLVEMHETDYNLALLRPLGIRIPYGVLSPKVVVPTERRAWAREWLRSQGYEPNLEMHRRLIGIHPGMGGSALNWPEEYYLEVSMQLLNEGHAVLITGGPLETDLLNRIRKKLESQEQKAIYFYGRDFPEVDRLAALYEFCDVVVAPSTGPLHVAGAVGASTVSFYPPIRVQSALRWGPYSTNPEHHSILHPEVFCGEDFKCRGSVCNYYPCMSGIQPGQALEEVHLQLGRQERKKI